MGVVLGTNAGFVTEAPSANPNGLNTTGQSRTLVVKDTSPATAAKITEIGWYCDNATEEANFEVGLYAANGDVVPGEAGTLLEFERTNAKGTDAGWKVVSVDWEIDAETDYWIGVQLDSTPSTTYNNYVGAGAAGRDYVTNQTTLTNPLDGGAIADPDGAFAIYAVWEAAAPEGTNIQVNVDDVLRPVDEIYVNKDDVFRPAEAYVNKDDVWRA